MEESGDGRNEILPAGKGVERLEIIFGEGNSASHPEVHKKFLIKKIQDRNRHIIEESSKCDVH